MSREAYQQVDVDHTEQSKVFGTISNHNMKKRTRHGKRSAPAPVPAPVEKKPALVKTASTAPSSAEPAKVKEEPKPAVKKEGVAATETPASSAFSSKKTAAAPKKGGIMSAFSKAASKPKAKPGSNVSTPKTENQSPALSDDGEDDEDPMPAPKQAADGTARRSRQDREAELRRMMEEESEEEEEPSEKEQEDEPMEEAPEPEPETKTEPEASQEPAEVVSSAPGSGRRRGRRQVMKKKQVMDDQGYLGMLQTPTALPTVNDMRYTDKLQLRSRRKAGSRSRKTSQPLSLRSPSPHQPLAQEVRAQRRRLHRKAKGTSCPSFRRSRRRGRFTRASPGRETCRVPIKELGGHILTLS